ncbi:MAG: hypothetical protein LBG93_01935 [Treponema sp.]|jgi:hypothetical protein|nr:hypothetical protein [Treponema sp.]
MAENTLNNISLQDHLRAVMDEVSAKLREVAESQKETDRKFQEVAESQKETDRRFKETDRQMKESSRETDKKLQEAAKIVRRNSKQMGDLHRRFGELAEHLVAPNIHKRFNELGYHFGSHSPGGVRIYDEQGNTKVEIDLLLENGTTIMALEVKTRPAIKDVEHHIKRLEILRDHRRSINDKRIIKGAIAGAIFGTEEKKATREAGLYVVEQSGDTMKIDVPKDFVAREW